MAALERLRDVWRRFTGRGTYPHELAFLLLTPLRALVLSPAEVVRRLGAAPDARVLEVGPGPGYFSRAVAAHLGRGRLELLDLQREMLAKARRWLLRGGGRARATAGFTQGDAARLPYRDGAFDAAFLVAVLGEVPDPPACVAEVARVLRHGGVLSVSELPGDPDALSEPAVRRMAEAAGLAPAERFATRGGFTANYRKPGP